MTNGGRILLVRHGSTAWNRGGRFQGWRDLPLNAEGRAQAEALRIGLPRHGAFAEVHSSDLRRARETAEILFPDRPVRTDRRLRELHFGEFEGWTAAEAEERAGDAWRRWLSDPMAHPPPGGESLGDFRERIRDWVEEVLDITGPAAPPAHTRIRGAAGITVVVAHGGTVGFLMEVLGSGSVSCSVPPPGRAVFVAHPGEAPDVGSTETRRRTT